MLLLTLACRSADDPTKIEPTTTGPSVTTPAPEPVPTTPEPEPTTPEPTTSAPVTVDLDGDGLDDATELALATSYLPFVSVSPDDGCPTMGIVFRASPHPKDPTKVHLVYALLYDVDCGASGHDGDDEVFGATIDPAVPPPAGILALKAIAHQNTPCQHVSTCGCPGSGLPACETTSWNGDDWPVLWPSVDKHGNYLSESACDGACFFTSSCDLAPAPPTPLLVDAGEPGAPLTDDLTDAGLITSANGWTSAELFHYDPWGDTNFGGAGDVTSDLTDSAFDTPAPSCNP